MRVALLRGRSLPLGCPSLRQHRHEVHFAAAEWGLFCFPRIRENGFSKESFQRGGASCVHVLCRKILPKTSETASERRFFYEAMAGRRSTVIERRVGADH
jgi:hypothetical protein